MNFKSHQAQVLNQLYIYKPKMLTCLASYSFIIQSTRGNEVTFVRPKSMFSWAYPYQILCSAFVFEETHTRVLDLTAFMSLHRLMLLLMTDTWLRGSVQGGFHLGPCAIKLLVCPFAGSSQKIIYNEVFGFFTSSQTKPLSGRSQRPEFPFLFLLGIGLPFLLLIVFGSLPRLSQAYTIFEVEKDLALTSPQILCSRVLS